MTHRRHCAVIRGYINSEIEKIKTIGLCCCYCFPTVIPGLDQESKGYGGTYPSLHCTAHEDKVPGPCQG